MSPATATLAPVYRARPTLRFRGEVDERASELVREMSMSESEGGMRSLVLELSNWASTRGGGAELAFEASDNLRLGGEIEVYGGEVDRPLALFQGRITALEGVHERGRAPRLRVLAEDALMGARMVRRSRVFRDQSPADTVRSVAGELGLNPVISGLEAPVRSRAQVDETDLAFLRRILVRLDADLQIVGEELHASPRDEVRRAELTLDVQQDLRTLEVSADLAHQVTSLSVRGWDATQGRAVLAERSSGTHLGPGRGQAGAQVLAEAMAERPENLGHLTVETQEEADALAEAAFDRRARRFVQARGVTEGNPELRVGVHLTLGGIGRHFANDYYVVATRHLYDPEAGYQTEFTAECAFLGGAS